MRFQVAILGHDDHEWMPDKFDARRRIGSDGGELPLYLNDIREDFALVKTFLGVDHGIFWRLLGQALLRIERKYGAGELPPHRCFLACNLGQRVHRSFGWLIVFVELAKGLTNLRNSIVRELVDKNMTNET